MAWKIDPDVLAKVAQRVVGVPVENGELIARTAESLSAEYPGLIDPIPRRWIGTKAGGVLGKISFLYAGRPV
jgi:hypothetical protein